MIHTCALQSGSNGNCFYVETGDTRLIIDAGISGRQAQTRLSENDRQIWDVDAVLISHNHADHVSHAGVLQRKLSVPLYMTHGTWQAARGRLGQLRNNGLNCFEPGQVLRFNETQVYTIPTPHDGIAGVAFVVCYCNKKLGVFTDLGHRFDGLDQWLSDLDGLYIESNYDPDMLANGPYPYWLQRRITGAGGHLSNQEAMETVRDSCDNLQVLILSHLSEHNNRPALARQIAETILGTDIPIHLARRDGGSRMFVIQ